MADFVQIGSNIVVLINNKSVGTITSFQYNVDYGKKSIRGIDNPFPQEIAPGPQTVRGQIGMIRLKDDSLENRGITSDQVSRDAGISQQVITNMLTEPYISITLMDRHVSMVVFRCDRATVMSQEWRVNARGIFEGSFSFEGFLMNPVE